MAQSLDGRQLARVLKTFIPHENSPTAYPSIIKGELLPAYLTQVGLRHQELNDFIAEMADYYTTPDALGKEVFDQLVASNVINAQPCYRPKSTG